MTETNIDYIEQYRIDYKLLNHQYCFIDFYLPKYNTFIEYNGQQHYRPVKIFGGEGNFKKQLERDTYVREYCSKNKINLIEISYKDSISSKLKTIINE